MHYKLAEIDTLPRLLVATSPLEHRDDALSIERCGEVVAMSQVRARGWYFPHINRDALTAGPRARYLENETEVFGFVQHLEKWRMYRNGQFLFKMMLWEVPNLELQAQMRADARWVTRENEDRVQGFISFVMLIYSVTEAFLFASRLAQAVPYRTASEVIIGLRDVANWALGSSNPGVSLNGLYAARDASPEYSVEVPLDDLVAQPLAAAVPAIQGLFAQFGWLDAAPGMIEGWQRNQFSRPGGS